MIYKGDVNVWNFFYPQCDKNVVFFLATFLPKAIKLRATQKLHSKQLAVWESTPHLKSSSINSLFVQTEIKQTK